MENTRQSNAILQHSAKFEINNTPFQSIHVDQFKLIATGKKWNHFELLISFIGGAWKEKWRKYGLKLLPIGIMIMMLGMTFLLSRYTIIMGVLLIAVGIIPIAIALFVKSEGLMLYTHGGTFLFEGSAGFVDAIWEAINAAQAHRNL
ncbi:MAG: hypothetical protein ACTSV2_06655 [Candidatus Thorarchaeota archaeon]